MRYSVRFQRLSFLIALLALWTSAVFAGPAHLVRDIASSPTQESVAFSWGSGRTAAQFLLFEQPTASLDIWRTDGTPEGTTFTVGTGLPLPGNPLDVYSYFTAGPLSPWTSEFDWEGALALYRTDGTVSGTQRIVLPPDIAKERPGIVDRLGNKLLLASHSGYLYVSDGTTTGTTPVKRVTTTVPFYYTHAGALNGSTFFTCNDGVHGSEIWCTDGTADGTQLVKDIFPGPTGPSVPDQFALLGSILLFRADDGVYGRELWKTDGTEIGTVLVKDICPGSNSSSPYRLAKCGSRVVFIAQDPTYAYYLWSTDGTDAGTTQLLSLSGIPTIYVVAQNLLYFNGPGGLYRTDGTQAGTTVFAPVQPVGDCAPAGNYLVYSAYDTPPATGLYSVNLSSAIASKLGSVSEPLDLRSFGGRVLFRCGYSLWATDGTDSGTTLLSDVHRAPSSTPRGYSVIDGILYFRANEDSISSVYTSDGTEAGTHAASAPVPIPFNGTKCGNRYYYGDQELWAYEPGIGSWMYQDIYPASGGNSNPTCFATLDASVFFSARTDWPYPWPDVQYVLKTTGTGSSAFIHAIRHPGLTSDYLFPAVFAGQYWFSDGFSDAETQLWKSNGDSAVAVPAPWAGFNPQNLCVSGNLLFFTADGAQGRELWKTDGSAAGTLMVRDIFPGASGSNPCNLVDVNGLLMFCADDGEHGFELWRSDGTEAGTWMVSDIFAGSMNSQPNGISVPGSARLYLFAANDGEHGCELWRSDGTPSGTWMIQELTPGPFSSYPESFSVWNGNVFFTASQYAADGTGGTGAELWAIPVSALQPSGVADWQVY